MENGLMTWTDVLLRSFAAFGAKLMSFLPNLLGALLLLALAALLASFLRRVVSKGLGMIGFDALPAKVFGKERAERFMDDAAPSILAGKMVYWLTILLFLVTIAETLGWQVVSEKTSDLIGYLPRLFSAVLIFIIGYYIATFIRNALDATFGSMSGDTGNAISRVAYYIILVFISITALDQAGVDTTLLTANISIIIGAVMVAFAVAFALAAKGILHNILSFLYSRDHLELGQEITMGDVHGTIVAMDHMYVVVHNNGEDILIPTREFTEQRVRIKRKSSQK
ncbi:MAG TPA: mechanosensitive ion channel [Flavobacteriales bacterium]|nr:mechanosensitive ion channel [Flavobacteriales bacterium]MBK7483344.1 mechanosensitive ion channel [Flavobacteriales bacterium]MBK8530472.1 mechanosensitive ion channel [Flavobacteriales bacterium]MBP9178831.1 mechanosensitive ion channel [Flavobacteriales bacterium]HQW06140.1 mechanosensitive ion channel [Flavobacteriales bacterium]